jgi:hypothetical protein
MRNTTRTTASPGMESTVNRTTTEARVDPAAAAWLAASASPTRNHAGPSRAIKSTDDFKALLKNGDQMQDANVSGMVLWSTPTTTPSGRVLVKLFLAPMVAVSLGFPAISKLVGDLYATPATRAKACENIFVVTFWGQQPDGLPLAGGEHVTISALTKPEIFGQGAQFTAKWSALLITSPST